MSRAFGGDRGTPVDRRFIEAFLARHAPDIRGRVAEIGDAAYTRRFGGDAVRRSDVIDAPGVANDDATLRLDLVTGRGLPRRRFDCLIVTQTLHMIYEVGAAVRTLHRCLAPGGVVLATVPGITQIDAADGPGKWFWPMTQSAALRLFAEVFGPDRVAVEPHGNVLAATAFLQGLAAEEIDPAAFAVADPLYPVITGIRAVRGG